MSGEKTRGEVELTASLPVQGEVACKKKRALRRVFDFGGVDGKACLHSAKPCPLSKNRFSARAGC
jgi:hypothetical protein